MKRYAIFWVFLLAAALAVPVWTVFSDPDAAGEPERMDTASFESPRRPGAVFSHDEHNETAGLEDNCAVCHHVYEDGRLLVDESSEGEYCADCHSLKPTKENGISLEVAYHRQCRDCHFETGKGPVLCGECHIKL